MIGQYLTVIFSSYKVLLRGKPVSGDPKQDGSLLLDEIEPTRKKWKLGKTKVQCNFIVFCFFYKINLFLKGKRMLDIFEHLTVS